MNTSIFKRPFFWYGIYYGIASILIFALIYTINFEFFGRFFMWMLIGLAVLATFMITGGFAERKANQGYLKYGKAFLVLFLIGLIGYTINLLFTVVFVNFIDTEFNKNLAEVMKESTLKFMQSFGEVPEEKIEEAMNNMDKQFANANSWMNYLKQFLGGAFMSAVVALLGALVVKRNPPENMSDSQVLDTEA